MPEYNDDAAADEYGKIDPTDKSALSMFQHHLLIAIAANNGESGQVIKCTLNDAYDEPINHGRLYPNIDRLVDLGCVEKGELDRRANAYAITERGLKAVVAELEWRANELRKAGVIEGSRISLRPPDERDVGQGLPGD